MASVGSAAPCREKAVAALLTGRGVWKAEVSAAGSASSVGWVKSPRKVKASLGMAPGAMTALTLPRAPRSTWRTPRPEGNDLPIDVASRSAIRQPPGAGFRPSP